MCRRAAPTTGVPPATHLASQYHWRSWRFAKVAAPPRPAGELPDGCPYSVSAAAFRLRAAWYSRSSALGVGPARGDRRRWPPDLTVAPFCRPFLMGRAWRWELPAIVLVFRGRRAARTSALVVECPRRPPRRPRVGRDRVRDQVRRGTGRARLGSARTRASSARREAGRRCTGAPLGTRRPGRASSSIERTPRAWRAMPSVVKLPPGRCCLARRCSCNYGERQVWTMFRSSSSAAPNARHRRGEFPVVADRADLPVVWSTKPARRSQVA